MSPALRQALIGAGANLGDRETTLCSAIEQLRANPAIPMLVVSPFYETDPVGVTDQPLFLNLVLGVETSLTPEELLGTLQAQEKSAGRVRDVRWGPRTLDLDLLAFEDETRASPGLQLPHPRMLERAFVTTPLRDVLGLPRFQRPAWSDLRKQLAAQPQPAGGVRLWPNRAPRHG
jgi:2-amino-4-hydroxy-6-hydroxymethyldihydropteridine diphosphokinase